jgi:hypothetical protein
MLQIFNFKGLYQAGKKMAVPLGYFRRLTNTYKDRTGRLVPYGRGDNGATENEPNVTIADSAFYAPVFSTEFNGEMFQLIRGYNAAAEHIGAFKYGESALSQPYVDPSNYTQYSIPLDAYMEKMPGDSYTSAVVFGKVFVCEYIEDIIPSSDDRTYTVSNIFRFDGQSIRRAGLPTPWASVPMDTATGDRRLRTVYVSIGLDGEAVFSNYLEVKFKAATGTKFYPSYKDSTSTDVADAVGDYNDFLLYGAFSNVSTKPLVRMPDDSLFDFEYIDNAGAAAERPAYYDYRHARPNGTPTISLDGEVNFESDYHNCEVGDWLLHITTPWVGKYAAYMLQCKSKTQVVGSTYEFFFEPVIKMLNASTLSWETRDLTDSTDGFYIDLITGNAGLANIWALNFESGNVGGTLPYYYQSMYPIYWGSDIHFTHVPGVPYTDLPRPILGVVTYDFDDWYDTTDVKVQFPNVVGITSYTGLLVGFDRNALYFSATSLGGSTEMTSGNSNFVPTGEEYGPIVAICGTEDFLFVSRQRRNFILRGELSTGNISTLECDASVAGAINARAVSNSFSGRVVFVNKSGIFSVDGSGSVQEISKDIQDLFLDKSPDGNLFSVDNLKTKVEVEEDTFDGTFIKIALEETRGFILVMTGRFSTGYDLLDSNMLVYDTADGSWYEFQSSGATSVECLNGKIVQLGQSRTEEDGVLYSTVQLVATNWITLDRPSMEKQVKQVKMYGVLRSGATHTVNIGNQNQFQPLDGTATSDYETYAPFNATTDATQFTHKKRLDSSKSQATSIIFHQPAEPSVDGKGFEIEGIELEIDLIQEGIKK